MSYPFRAIGIYEFIGTDDTELSIQEGQKITVTGEGDGGWYLAHDDQGKQGYVPQGFVEAISEPVGDPIPAEAPVPEPEEEQLASPKGESKSRLKKGSSKKKLGEDGKKLSKEKKKTSEKEPKSADKEKKKKPKKDIDPAAVISTPEPVESPPISPSTQEPTTPTTSQVSSPPDLSSKSSTFLGQQKPIIPQKRLSSGSPEIPRALPKVFLAAPGTEPPPVPRKGPLPPPTPSSTTSDSIMGTKVAGFGAGMRPKTAGGFGSPGDAKRPLPSLPNHSVSTPVLHVTSSAHTRSVSESRSSVEPLPLQPSPSNGILEPSPSVDSISTVQMSSRINLAPVFPNFTSDDEKVKKRFFIVKEIVTTERSYVEGMDEGLTKYFKPMMEAAKLRSPATAEEVKSIFYALEHLKPLNNNLLKSLEERVVNWSETQRIGDVFVRFAPFLKMYTTYSSNYDNAQQTLFRMSTEQWFQELGMNSHSIESILITPVQRIPRYNLLLTDLLANTPSDHVDQSDISKSLTTIRDVAEHINKGVGISKNVQRLTDAGFGHLLAPHRSLIKDGTITVVKPDSEKKRKIGDKSDTKKLEHHFLVFSDVLVIINQGLDENLLPKKDKKSTLRLKIIEGKPKERKEISWPLGLMWLRDPGLRTGFDLIGPLAVYNLYFNSSEERDEWWNALDGQIKVALSKVEGQVAPTMTSPAVSLLDRKGPFTFTTGHSYDGEWRQGVPHGKGVMTCPGVIFEGTFDMGYKSGTGVMNYLTGHQFTGSWRGGKPNGEGVMVYSSGERYDGEFRDGKRSGKGLLSYKDGSTYNGEWRNDMPNGQGTLTMDAIQFKFVGSFVDGKFSGNGVLTSYQGKYEGGFKDNLCSSRGKMNYMNGSIYEGEWKEGYRHGAGRWVGFDGSTYEGEWKADYKEGRGLMKWHNGDEYMGTWSGDKPHGSGLFTYKAGTQLLKYDGDFSHGKRQGKGTAYYQSGAKYEGEWQDDVQQGFGKMHQHNGVLVEGKWVNGIIEPAKCVIMAQGAAPIVVTAESADDMFQSFAEVPFIPFFESSGLSTFARPY